MSAVRNVLSRLTYAALLSCLLAGAALLAMLLYMQSPRWLLAAVDDAEHKTFFVAYRAAGEGTQAGRNLEALKVVRYRAGESAAGSASRHYDLPVGRIHHNEGSGESAATIDVEPDPAGGQRVQVFMTGDTPWTSLSEYRVVDNRVQPLRHAHSAAWLLLGVLLFPWLVLRMQGWLRRQVRRLYGLEGAAQDASDGVTPPA